VVCALAVSLFGSTVTAAAQEPAHVTFACEEGAVDVTIDRTPTLKLEPRGRRPALSLTPHEFRFHGPPFEVVRVYLTATVPEDLIGRGSQAQLAVYVETAATADDAANRRTRWWELVPAVEPQEPQADRPSQTLTVDAKAVAACVTGQQESDCSFADIALAAPDTGVPLIVVGFREDLGGANADNWVDARLLLDFRSDPPRVAVTADCAYNEGGGACTAIDSGMMDRSTLSCEWAAAAGDLLCTQTAEAPHTGYRDFHLLSGRAAPPRAGEVTTLADAASALGRLGIGQSIVVHGLGPVTWIDELADKRAMLLASASGFYMATGTDQRNVLGVRPHALLEAGTRASIVDTPPSEWTGRESPEFVSRRLFTGGGLTVFQVVERAAVPPDLPASALYWIGIDESAASIAFDVVRLAGDGTYDHCGMFNVPASVVSAGRVTAPFRAPLRIQPPTFEADFSDEVEWGVVDEPKEDGDCIRNGTLSWTEGAFRGEMAGGRCAAIEKPGHVRVERDGRLTLEKPK